MSRISKYILWAGILIGVFVGGVAVYAAIDHNPQGEFSDNAFSLIPIFLIWMGIFSVPCALLSALIEIFKAAKPQRSSKNILISLLLLSLLVLFSCTKIQNDENAIINKPYHEARKLIMQDGWEPTSEFQDEIYKEDQEKYGYSHPFIELGYNELGSCSGGGEFYCDFYFKKNDNTYIRVVTKGEDNGQNSSTQTRVIDVGVVDKKTSTFGK
jgi:hypothetical protein